jgi:hypothetical protein
MHNEPIPPGRQRLCVKRRLRVVARDGQKFADGFVKPFIWDFSAKANADQFAKGMSFSVRVKPGQPGVSIADASVENWRTMKQPGARFSQLV